jgi:hypothetical protein
MLRVIGLAPASDQVLSNSAVLASVDDPDYVRELAALFRKSFSQKAALASSLPRS